MLAAQGQGVADDFVEALLENLGQAIALLLVFELAVEGIDVGGEAALFPEVIPDVFISRQDETGIHFETLGQKGGEMMGVIFGEAVGAFSSATSAEFFQMGWPSFRQ